MKYEFFDNGIIVSTDDDKFGMTLFLDGSKEYSKEELKEFWDFFTEGIIPEKLRKWNKKR